MLQRLLRSETAAAIALISAAIVAIIVANSPLSSSYEDLLHAHVLGISVQHWVNDALMAIFFLLVGLEIKQEVLFGQLATWRRRALPGLAAVGGMIVPSLIFVLINRQHSQNLDGWAIPSATDIAFAIGAIAILGPRVPPGVRVLLVGIAIVDDLLAIVVIALFYTADLSVAWIGAAMLCAIGLTLLNRRRVNSIWPYLAVGVALWIALYQSGLHATLAGVALAFAIPAHTTESQHRSPLKTTEHAIDRWVNFGILPIFAFANAGIAFSGVTKEDVLGTLPLGIALGLFLGKQIGVFGSVWLLVRFGIAELPPRVRWPHVHAMSILCGIGFTMSLFIGGLAFAESTHLMNATRIGVLGGSLVSATVGILAMRRLLPTIEPTPRETPTAEPAA